MASAAAGSRDAFDELVVRHQMRIYKLARMLTGGDADAEDLVQETFVRAFRGIGRFRVDKLLQYLAPPGSPSTSSSLHWSRLSRQVQIAPSPPGDESDALVDRVPSNEDLETATVQRDAIDRALATLPEELRLLVTLRDVQGLG